MKEKRSFLATFFFVEIIKRNENVLKCELCMKSIQFT